MKIVDSSLWVEYFLGNFVEQPVIEALMDTENLLVPVISLYEVYRKIFSISNSERANTAGNIMQNAVVIGVSPEMAILAAQLGKQYKLPMADSIIYATAVMYDTEIYTQDKHFENLDRVYYFEKNKNAQ